MSNKEKFYDYRWRRPIGPAGIQRDRGLVLDPSEGRPRPPAPKGPILTPEPPALPVPTLPTVPDSGKRPPAPKGGPFDVREPIAGDPYRYPEFVEPPALPLSAKIDAWLLAKARQYVNRRGIPYKLPELPGRQPAPPERQLPSELLYWMDDDERRDVEASVSMSVSAAALTDWPALLEEAKKPLPSKHLDLLTDWLKANGIRYFSGHELIRHNWKKVGGRISPIAAYWFLFDHFDGFVIPKGIFATLPRYVIPPPWLWPNILPALRVLDRFRHWLGEPVVVYSGYRHPHYNGPEHLEGSVDSFHMSFAALDFTYRARDSNGNLDSRVFLEFFERYREQGDGLGRYHEPHNFLHLDVGLQRHLLKGKTENWWRPKGHPREMK